MLDLANLLNKVTLHGNGFQALEWRHDAKLQCDIVTLHLCAETVAISSTGPPNLSKFFIRELIIVRCWFFSQCRVKVRLHCTSCTPASASMSIVYINDMFQATIPRMGCNPSWSGTSDDVSIDAHAPDQSLTLSRGCNNFGKKYAIWNNFWPLLYAVVKRTTWAFTNIDKNVAKKPMY